MDIISYKDAKLKGLRHYFTGKPCKRGHIALRRVGDCNCTECSKLHTHAWKNTEKGKEKEREWREKNKEKLKAQGRARYAKNPEKYVNKTKKYYQKNGHKVRAHRRAYHYHVYRDDEVRVKAQARTRDWAKANPEKAKTNARNGKAKRKNVQGKHTASDIAAILKMQHGKCAYCKIKLGKKFHIDHILAVSRGGTNDRQNLQITCMHCNLRKGATDPIIFAQRQGMLL